MTVARNIADVLTEHVTFEVECIDGSTDEFARLRDPVRAGGAERGSVGSPMDQPRMPSSWLSSAAI